MEKIRITAEIKHKKTNKTLTKTWGEFALDKEEIQRAVDLAVFKSRNSEYVVRSLSANGTILWLNSEFS